MNKLIVANWKSNPKTLSEAVRLAKATDAMRVVIAPPYLYLEGVGKTLKYAVLASQDVFWENGGPYTGEVSPLQLKSLRVKYVIIGHSERRRLGETDITINRKVKAALKAGLKVILCVGEDKAVRRKGVAVAKRFVAAQLKKDLAGIRAPRFMLRDSLTIAYEPVWAISTSKGAKPDTPKNAAQMISYIKKILDSRYQILVPVLYGGSVIPRNAKSFLSQPEIDGALVGGASLNPKSFKAIINR